MATLLPTRPSLITDIKLWIGYSKKAETQADRLGPLLTLPAVQAGLPSEGEPTAFDKARALTAFLETVLPQGSTDWHIAAAHEPCRLGSSTTVDDRWDDACIAVNRINRKLGSPNGEAFRNRYELFLYDWIAGFLLEHAEGMGNGQMTVDQRQAPQDPPGQSNEDVQPRVERTLGSAKADGVDRITELIDTYVRQVEVGASRQDRRSTLGLLADLGLAGEYWSCLLSSTEQDLRTKGRIDAAPGTHLVRFAAAKVYARKQRKKGGPRLDTFWKVQGSRYNVSVGIADRLVYGRWLRPDRRSDEEVGLTFRP